MLSQAVEEDQQKPALVMAEALVTDGKAGIGAEMPVGRKAEETMPGPVMQGRMEAVVVIVTGVTRLGNETEAGNGQRDEVIVSTKTVRHTDRRTEAALR